MGINRFGEYCISFYNYYRYISNYISTPLYETAVSTVNR